MTDEQVESIIQGLESVRERPAMYAGARTEAAVGAFLSGFDCACRALGLSKTHEARRRAKEERGWPDSAEVWSVSAMRERGLTEAEIADEMLLLEVLAWRRMDDTDAA